MEKKHKKQESEKKATDKSQEHYDYSRIEALREKVWSDSKAKKNWEEFDKRRKANQ